MKKRIIIAAAVLLAAALSLTGAIRAGGDIEAQKVLSIKNAVVSCAVQCCAIEGAYPRDIKYLEDNYGLVVDQTKYIVTYDLFASNIMPDISVIKKNG